MGIYGLINISGKILSSYLKSQSDMKFTTHDTVCDVFKKYVTPPPPPFSLGRLMHQEQLHFN